MRSFELEESPREAMSSFLRWAHNRIEREIRSNDDCADLVGDNAISAYESNRASYLLTLDEKAERVERVDRIRSNMNLGVAEACKTANVHYTTYYKWKNLLRDKRCDITE